MRVKTTTMRQILSLFFLSMSCRRRCPRRRRRRRVAVVVLVAVVLVVASCHIQVDKRSQSKRRS